VEYRRLVQGSSWGPKLPHVMVPTCCIAIKSFCNLGGTHVVTSLKLHAAFSRVDSEAAKAAPVLQQGSHLAFYFTPAMSTFFQAAYPLAVQKDLSKQKCTKNVTFLPCLTRLCLRKVCLSER
jgi:hypothetical protein